MKNVQDIDLVKESTRNPEAFGVLYDRHWQWIYLWLLRKQGDKDTAFELMLEVFTQALKDRGKFQKQQDSTSIAPWLFGIMKNRFFDWQRASQKDERTIKALKATTNQSNDFQDDLIQTLTAEGWNQKLKEALQTLPPKQQEAIALHVIADWSYQEISSQLSCHESVIRQRVSRGLKQLRSSFTHPSTPSLQKRTYTTNQQKGCS